MFQSLTKKGFTLVEVICSLGVFAIIFICMMSFDVTSLNMKKDIKTINNNVLIIEALKNNIIYNMTFVELKQLETEKRVYINKENMDFDKIKTGGIGLFSNQALVENAYIKCDFVKDILHVSESSYIKSDLIKNISTVEVYKVSLSLLAGGNKDILEFQCNFYKGDHK
ncbi:MAG TPA: prepilin-type N-terminal cleavage/methylation domain-containing protein [Clostridium sp.]|uniref:type II secretion system protein n=1 Tax=Clostridium sp. TaxID=1506 RepID=UPI002F946C75